jgi:hypothetical protein
MFIQRSHLSFSKLTHLLVAYSMLLMCAHTQAQGTSPTGAPKNPTQGNPRPTKQSSDSNDAVLKALGAAAVIGAGAIILNKVFGKKEEPAKPPVAAAPPAPTASAPVVWIGAPKSAAVIPPSTAQPKPQAHKPDERLAKLKAQAEEAQARINTLTESNKEMTNALGEAEKKLNAQAAAISTAQQSANDAQTNAIAAEHRAVTLREQLEKFKQRAWWWAALAVAALLGLAAALARALWFVKPKLVTVSVSPGAWSLHAEQAHAEPKGCFKIHTEWQAVRALVQKYEPNSLPDEATLRTA